MAGISKYTKAVLTLTAGFALFCGGWFGHQFSMPVPYQVNTAQRISETDYSGMEGTVSAGASLSGADARPDSLLPGEVINVNTADLYDLQRLPGIGEKRAQDIIAYREEHGPFQTVDELTNVSGIGPVILENLREYAAAEHE